MELKLCERGACFASTRMDAFQEQQKQHVCVDTGAWVTSFTEEPRVARIGTRMERMDCRKSGGWVLLQGCDKCGSNPNNTTPSHVLG